MTESDAMWWQRQQAQQARADRPHEYEAPNAAVAAVGGPCVVCEAHRADPRHRTEHAN